MVDESSLANNGSWKSRAERLVANFMDVVAITIRSFPDFLDRNKAVADSTSENHIS